MKLNKLLGCVIPTTAIAVVSPIMLTSCNRDRSNAVHYSGSKTFKISGTTHFYLYFELSHNLTEGENLNVKMSGLSGNVGCKYVTHILDTIDIEVEFEITSSESGQSTFDLEFYSTDANSHVIWNSKITNFTLIYIK